MLDLQVIRRALADQLRAGLDPTLNVYAYLPDAPKFPLVAVMPDPATYVNYFNTMAPYGTPDVHLEIHIAFTSRAEDAQIALDNLLSIGSSSSSTIVDVVMADRTLGGTVADAVTSISRFVAQGEENAGIFEAIIPVGIMLSQTTWP